MKLHVAGTVVLTFAVASAMAQSVDPKLTQHLRWRCIGPHRGGRTVGAAGIPSRPNEFYIGVNNGGVWKTTDAGRTWVPVFDDQPTGSIGCVTVVPSQPDTVFVGSGEGLQRPDLSVGDGVYKSLDGGKTWKNMGLQDGLQICDIAVHPKDPNLVFTAVLGHPYGPNETRGLYRSRDGGVTWKKILGPDENTGATQVVLDPKNPNTVYCALWSARQAPWENGRWQGPGSGLYKSLDGGDTWKRTDSGLPNAAKGLGRIGIGVAASDPRRIYACVDAREGGGVYRSDDAGSSWTLMSNDQRLWGRGDDFAEIRADPTEPDTVYCANTASYKSTDGGKTWKGWKGAPGGDDYHTIWINPTNPKIILLAVDQGATITVNGGETWSSWYNQPTAQFYHVSTDNQWPYWVYGGQQESGSVGIASRGNDGQITFREWHPVGVEEYGYVAVDPLDPNIVFGGKITKYDKRTGQVQSVGPTSTRGGQYRFLRTAPVLFSPIDPHLLYFSGNVLFSTKDGGSSWEVLSPDLSRPSPGVPYSFRGLLATERESEVDVDDPDKPKTGPALEAELQQKALSDPGRRGVIYSVGPSHFTTKTIWCGTDDGLVWLTRDGGKNWKNVTPPGVTDWAKVTQIDAGHFDDETAYVSVNRIRCDDQKPYIYVTHDGAKTWRLAVTGLADDPVNAVREDPKQQGLLYCATERMVCFSTDDGLHWNSLRLNMPCSSIRDIVVHEDDLVIGTHGRSFWILDNVSSLREIVASGTKTPALFTPQLATRVEWNMNTDTPLPPEEPGGQNPPDGAMIDYYLAASAKSVSLEILDSSGNVVRHYANTDKLIEADPYRISLPTYWLRKPTTLSTESGAHRWLWDMRRQPLSETSGGVPMAAIVHDTPAQPKGPWVPPGTYTVRLTVDGEVTTKPITVRLDPRVTTPSMGIKMQSDITSGSYDALVEIASLLVDVKKMHERLIHSLSANPEPRVANKLSSIEHSVATLESTPRGEQGVSFGSLQGLFGSLMNQADECDMEPTQTLVNNYRSARTAFATLKKTWEQLKNTEF